MVILRRMDASISAPSNLENVKKMESFELRVKSILLKTEMFYFSESTLSHIFFILKYTKVASNIK
mgnify:CR=1 FL=1